MFMKFRDHGSRMKHDYVIYCDLEAILRPYSTAYPNPDRSATTQMNQHIPCGYCYVVVCSDGTLLKEPVLEHGENIIHRLLVSLQKEQDAIMERRGPEYPIDMSAEAIENFHNATHCMLVMSQSLGLGCRRCNTMTTQKNWIIMLVLRAVVRVT